MIDAVMTDTDNPPDAVAIFHAVLELPAAARKRRLDDLCSRDRALRATVEALLAHHDMTHPKLGGATPHRRPATATAPPPRTPETAEARRNWWMAVLIVLVCAPLFGWLRVQLKMAIYEQQFPGLRSNTELSPTDPGFLDAVLRRTDAHRTR